MQAIAFDLSTPYPSLAIPGKSISLPSRPPYSLLEALHALYPHTLNPGVNIVFTIGPGSFTGIRKAISIALGFFYAHQVHLYAIPTLSAVAYACPKGGKVLVATPAGKRGWYWATVDKNDMAQSLSTWERGEKLPKEAWVWENKPLAPVLLECYHEFAPSLPPIQPCYGSPPHVSTPNPSSLS